MVLLGQTSACDLNLDGRVDSNDVQLAINMSLGLAPCTANISGANVCNVVVVQRVVNASMGSTCVTGSGIHSVSLTWSPSASAGVTGYNVLRATSPTETPTFVAFVGLATSYTDTNVQAGPTYYYVVQAVDSVNNTSGFSNQAQAVIPVP